MNSVYCRESLTAILIIGLLASPASVYAQQKVYKWVDEDGVVHFSEEPPDESPKDEVEVFTTDPAPPYVPPAQTTIKSPSASETDVENQSAQPKIQIRPEVKELDITEMSLSDLDRRCEDAREDKIAPLREAAIESCKQESKQARRSDPAVCESFYADFGDGGQTASGGFRQPMFVDLPECVEALHERNTRRR